MKVAMYYLAEKGRYEQTSLPVRSKTENGKYFVCVKSSYLDEPYWISVTQEEWLDMTAKCGSIKVNDDGKVPYDEIEMEDPNCSVE